MQLGQHQDYPPDLPIFGLGFYQFTLGITVVGMVADAKTLTTAVNCGYTLDYSLLSV